MKKLLALSFMLALAGCAEKKPLTPEEQWQGYCRSVGNAARTIMLDRQNAIEKEKAIEHANKIDDETTKGFIRNIIDEVYAIPAEEIKADVKQPVKKSALNLLQSVLRHRMMNYQITNRSKERFLKSA